MKVKIDINTVLKICIFLYGFFSFSIFLILIYKKNAKPHKNTTKFKIKETIIAPGYGYGAKNE